MIQKRIEAGIRSALSFEVFSLLNGQFVGIIVSSFKYIYCG